MQVTRVSGFTGVERTLEIDCTPTQIYDWQNGMVIQQAMPQLSADDREFIMTGVTAEEWGETFGED